MLSATPPGHKSRRLDSHQHDPVYRTGALLSRATSASIGSSTPWGSRTQTQPGFVVPAPVHWTGHGVRVRRAPSGLGGARIHVSGSSGRRYTISATNPTKKTRRCLRHRASRIPHRIRPSVTNASIAHAACSLFDQQTTHRRAVRQRDSTGRLTSCCFLQFRGPLRPRHPDTTLWRLRRRTGQEGSRASERL